MCNPIISGIILARGKKKSAVRRLTSDDVANRSPQTKAIIMDDDIVIVTLECY